MEHEISIKIHSAYFKQCGDDLVKFLKSENFKNICKNSIIKTVNLELLNDLPYMWNITYTTK